MMKIKLTKEEIFQKIVKKNLRQETIRVNLKIEKELFRKKLRKLEKGTIQILHKNHLESSPNLKMN
jgi:hypothetical protein